MQVAWQTLYFFLWTCCSLFLLVLLGEASIGIPLLSFIILGFILMIPYLRKNRLSSEFVWWVFWASYLSICIFSLLVSDSWVQTMNKIIFVGFSFIVSTSWYLIDRRYLDSKLLALGILLLGLVLAFSILILHVFFPDTGRLLPSMNLLVATYGHNHANIFFLICLPIAWRMWQQYDQEWWSWLPIAIFLLGITFSFGRVAIVIALLQLLWLGYQEFEQRSWPIFFRLMLGSTALVIIFFGWLSFMPTTGKLQGCPFPFFKTQLCKELIREERPAYWLQAIQGIVDRPLTGWGANTFPIVSKRFQMSSNAYSVYPHNEYLQWLVEFGLIAGSWLLFWWLRLAFSVVRIVIKKRTSKTWEQAFGLGVIAVWVDGFFNYNWNYVSVWTLSLILVAVVLRNEHVASKKINSILNQFIRAWLAIVVFLVLSWGAMYGLSTWWWQRGYYDQSLRFFPFVYWRVEDALLGKFPITLKTRQQLIRWYWNDHKMMYSAVVGTEAENEKQLLYRHLVRLQPLDLWSRTHLWRSAIANKNIEDLLQLLSESNSLFPVNQNWDTQMYDTTLTKDTIGIINSLSSSDPETAAFVLKVLIHRQPWEILYPKTYLEVFLFPENYSKETVSLFLQVWPNSDLWPYQKSMSNWWENQIRTAMKNQDVTQSVDLLRKYFSYFPYNKNLIWEVISKEMMAEWKTTHPDKKNQLLINWSDYLQLLETAANDHSETINWEFKNILLNQLVSQANLQLQSDPVSALELYLRAVEIAPLESVGTKILYLNPQTDHVNLDLWVQTLIQHNATELFSSSLENLHFLQKAATRAIQRKSYKEAEWLLQQQYWIWPNDYWVSAQMGNFWYMRADQAEVQNPILADEFRQKAQSEYEKCLTHFKDSTATDCGWGLRSLKENWQEGEQKYLRAAEEILRY